MPSIDLITPEKRTPDIDMIHLRVISPSDLTEKVVGLLAGDPGVLNLVVLPGRARNPAGDAVECDVLSGTANKVLPSLRRLQVD